MYGPILRAPILRLARSAWFRGLVTGTRLGRGVALRFVAGESLDDAIAAARSLDERRIGTILDHLGENVIAAEQAAQAAGDYVRALERIRDEPGVDCAISVKLTQLGLDFSSDLCVSHMESVLGAAKPSDALVMIDMESSVYVDRTLAVFRSLRERHERVGIALQSYLHRTAADVEGLPATSIVRLVKGAYLEPPEVAFPTRREVDGSFARLVAMLLDRGHTVHVATHDPRLIEGTKRCVARAGIPWSRVEFQMLYGIRRDLQGELSREGLPVRVYVPYGTEWYPYLTRRLAERPANMWFFFSNLLRSTR